MKDHGTLDLFPKMILTLVLDCTSLLYNTFYFCVRWIVLTLEYRVGAPACGDVMKLQIRVDENGRISDVKFKTFGCGSAIASSSFMTERVKGLTLEEAGAIKNTEVAKELCLPPVKCNATQNGTDFFCSALFNVG